MRKVRGPLLDTFFARLMRSWRAPASHENGTLAAYMRLCGALPQKLMRRFVVVAADSVVYKFADTWPFFSVGQVTALLAESGLSGAIRAL